MIFDYNVIWEALPLYFGGLVTTLKLLALSLFFGLLCALPLGLMRVSKNAVVNMTAWLYTYVIRGTPMLVQLFLIYYGLAQFEAVRESFLWPWLSSATFCACLAFAVNTSASNGIGSATINATGYSTPLATPVISPLAATTTPFLSSINVNTFKINGASTVGTACAESFTITINNNLTAKPCLGSESLIPNRYTEGKVFITLNVTLALTVASKAWIPYVETRETMTAEIGIEDTLGNAYGFDFTKLELDNDGLSDTNANDDHTLSMEFRHVKEAPTITRTTA